MFRIRLRAAAAIYEVESVAAGIPIFAGGYDLITASGTAPFLDHWVDRSMRYWTASPQGIVEGLAGGDVRAVRGVP